MADKKNVPEPKVVTRTAEQSGIRAGTKVDRVGQVTAANPPKKSS